MSNGMLPPSAGPEMEPVVNVRPGTHKSSSKTRTIITLSDKLIEAIDSQSYTDQYPSRNSWIVAAIREKLKRELTNQDALDRLLGEVL